MTNTTAKLTTVFVPPAPNMSTVTTGLVVPAPTKNNTSERYGVTCSTDAQLSKAQHVSTQSPSFGLGNPGNSVSALVSDEHSAADIITAPLPLENGDDWRYIAAEPEWLDALNVIVPAWGDLECMEHA